MEMTIHQALSELKLLDARINKRFWNNDIIYVGKKKVSESKEFTTRKDVKEFEEEVTANMDSVMGLIVRRNKIKSAIVISNATTMVTIGGTEMTVAEAIERKSSIQYDERFVAELKRQYNDVVKYVNSTNENAEREISSEVDRMNQSRTDKINVDDIDAYVKFNKSIRTWEIVDPCNIQSIISDGENYIETFKTEVDYVLSTSNALTTITVE